MFFCVLRAVKGEYGEVGKSLRVRWLMITVYYYKVVILSN